MACRYVLVSASFGTADVSWKAKMVPLVVLADTELSELGTLQLLDMKNGVVSPSEDRACRLAVHCARVGTIRIAPTCLATSALYSEVTSAAVMSTGSGT